MAVQMENLVLSEFQLQLTLLQLFSHFELFLRKGLLSLEMGYLVCENKAKLTASLIPMVVLVFLHSQESFCIIFVRFPLLVLT